MQSHEAVAAGVVVVVVRVARVGSVSACRYSSISVADTGPLWHWSQSNDRGGQVAASTLSAKEEPPPQQARHGHAARRHHLTAHRHAIAAQVRMRSSVLDKSVIMRTCFAQPEWPRKGCTARAGPQRTRSSARSRPGPRRMTAKSLS